MRQSSTGSTSCERWGASRYGRPGRGRTRRGCAIAGPPGRRDRRHGDVDGAAGQSRELLAHHLCLGRRCADSETCWKSQPPQRPAYRQGALTRSGEARSTSTASARRKRSPTSTFGDLRDDPLTREGMADKEHAPLVAGDAMSPWRIGPTSTSTRSPTDRSPSGPATDVAGHQSVLVEPPAPGPSPRVATARWRP